MRKVNSNLRYIYWLQLQLTDCWLSQATTSNWEESLKLELLNWIEIELKNYWILLKLEVLKLESYFLWTY